MKAIKTRVGWSAICIAMLALSAGCGGQKILVGAGVAPAAESGASGPLPGIPAGRESSAPVGNVRDGRQTYSRSANAWDVAAALGLLSTTTEMSWAIWEFEAEDRNLRKLSYDFTLPDGHVVYAAVADYSTGSWDIHGPLTGDTELPLYSLRHTSPGGLLYCAALTYKGGNATVVKIEMTADSGANQPPVAVLQADHPAGPAPLAVKFNAMSSRDPDGSIAQWEWDFDNDGQYSEAGAEQAAEGLAIPPAPQTFAADGSYSVTLRITDNGDLSSAATIEITVGGTNEPPHVDIRADPVYGSAPLQVSLNGGTSGDSDGNITDHEWDLDGDGVFSEPGPETTCRGSYWASIVLYRGGVHNLGLRLTDDGDPIALTGTDWIPITVIGDLNEPPQAILEADKTSGRPPMEVAFDASASSDPDGSIVDYEWDFDGDGQYNEPGNEEAARGLASPAPLTFSGNGSYSVSVQVTDNLSITGAAYLTIQVYDRVPVAGLTVDVDTGGAPLNVRFDASGSTDDGTIVNYEWDFDGDAVFNEPGFEAAAEGSAQPPVYSYTSNGWYMASVRVTDDASPPQFDTAAWLITVGGGGWTVISLGPASRYSQPALVSLADGRPAVSFMTATGDVRYAVSSTPTGEAIADWQVVTAGTLASSRVCPLAVINGNPAIAYQVWESERYVYTLSYAFSSTPDGASALDWTSITVDPYGVTGYNPSLAQINGKPAIVYGLYSGAVLYALSSSATGASPADWSRITIASGFADNGPNADTYSLLQVDGKPALSFSNYLVGQVVLQYLFSSTSDGASPGDWQIITVDDSSLFVGSGSSMALIAGKPAIAYGELYSGYPLKYTHSSTVGGTGAPDWSRLFADNVFGWDQTMRARMSLAQIAGKPAIAYVDNVHHYPRIAASSSPDGAAPGDWSSSIASGEMVRALGCSLAEVSGRAALAYTCEIAGEYYELRYAIREP
jgi:PKD repeat protein